jgi:phosphate ABC transporter permease protein PstC
MRTAAEPEETEVTSRQREAAAVEFDRPLLLTPGQDVAGFAGRIAGRTLLTLIASLTILAVLLIFAFIIRRAWPFFAERGFAELFASKQWHPTHEPRDFGALTMLYGSAIVTLGAMAIAVPLGLLAAVFLSDIASWRFRQIVKPVIEILAAIPSVAYGFFAFLVVAPWLQRHMASGANALNASVILAVMAMPTIVSISEDALTAVGRPLREGAYALGATRAEVLLKVVIPAARSGIIAAVILGIMRAVGETMLVWMAAGNATQIPSPWWDLTRPIRTLTASIAGEMGEAPEGGIHRQALFALGLILLTLTFALNLVSEYFLGRAKLKGGIRTR